MIKYQHIIVFFIAFLLTGCEKPPQAFKPAGRIEKQVRSVIPEGKIFLTDDVDLVFCDSVPVDEVWVVAGKYLLDWVVVEKQNDSLFIGNDNSANWLRSYNKRPMVKVNPSMYHHLEYDAAGHVICQSTVMGDLFTVYVNGGGGTINLNVNVSKLNISNNAGTVDIHVEGYSALTYLYGCSHGPIFCNDLKSLQVYMTNSGFNDIHSRAEKVFVGRINSGGNVYIYGDPETTDIACSGSGHFIEVK